MREIVSRGFLKLWKLISFRCIYLRLPYHLYLEVIWDIRPVLILELRISSQGIRIELPTLFLELGAEGA